MSNNFRVTTIEVSFTREKQPAQYEKSAPFVKLAGAVEEGTSGDHVAIARRLMSDACGTVYAALGMDIPSLIVDKLGINPASVGTVKVVTTDAPAQTNGAATAEGDTSPKRGRGRPAGAGNKKNEEANTSTGQQISNNPEDRKNPQDSEFPDEKPAAASAVKSAPETKAASEFPDEKPAAAAATPTQAAKLTQGDLQGYVTSLVQAKKISVPEVKAIMAEFTNSDGKPVGRTAELKDEDCLKMKAKVDEAVAKKG